MVWIISDSTNQICIIGSSLATVKLVALMIVVVANAGEPPQEIQMPPGTVEFTIRNVF